MDLALMVLAAAVIVAALILAFALARRRRRNRPSRMPGWMRSFAGQGAIAEQFRQTTRQPGAGRGLKQRLGDSLSDNATKTAETLGGIERRLSVIDEAQKNISALSGQVVSLQQVLSNKQSRGAFGQAQMEEIVRDGLPSSLYDFQFTLSNRNRPDCVIRIPGNKALLVIDSKFPLEGFDALRRAGTDEEKKAALAQVRARHRQACHRHRGKIPDPWRSPDAGHHVRAIGIDLCRSA